MKTSVARLWRSWMDLAGVIGTFQARLLLTLLYFTWLVPFGLLTRLFGDPLDIRHRGRPVAATGWKKRDAPGRTIEALRSQF